MRLGPGKSMFFGYFQMLFDGFKLFFSESFIILKSDDFYFFLTSVLRFILIVLVYFFLPFFFDFSSWNWNYLFLFIEIFYMVFSFLLSSFFSKSKYGFLGTIRIMIGSLSFDVVFVLFSFFFIGLRKDMGFPLFFWFFFYIESLFYFFIVILVEVNRSPFDFSEGERELVRGVNTEFSGVFFVFFFLTEYGSLFFYVIFMNNSLFEDYFLTGFLILWVSVFIRSCFPRYRIDYLVSLFWLIFLLIETFFLLFLVFLLMAIIISIFVLSTKGWPFGFFSFFWYFYWFIFLRLFWSGDW